MTNKIVNDLGATESEDAQIKTVMCTCDRGYRGMDNCNKCDGTGSFLVFGKERVPNTRDGYKKLLRQLRAMKK